MQSLVNHNRSPCLLDGMVQNSRICAQKNLHVPLYPGPRDSGAEEELWNKNNGNFCSGNGLGFPGITDNDVSFGILITGIMEILEKE